MPEVVLVPYPVVSQNFRTERWWLHGATARLLFSEYVKFLPSAARLGVARLLAVVGGERRCRQRADSVVGHLRRDA